MNIAVRSTLIMVVIYLSGLAGAAIWLERDYRETAREVMTDTAELITKQIANVLHEPTIDQLLGRDATAFSTLEEIVDSTIDRSAIVKSLAVVNAEGELVVGGDENNDYPTPKARFSGDSTVQLESTYRKRFSGGVHVAHVPILRAGKPIGYLKLVLGNKRISGLFDRLVNRLINFALIGLLAILILGGLLHVELTRLGREIILFMRDTSSLNSHTKKKGKHEFTEVRQEAKRLKHRAQQGIDDLNVLTEALKVGLVLFNNENDIVLINQNARNILETDSVSTAKDTFGAEWHKLEAALEGVKNDEANHSTLKLRQFADENQGALRIELFRSTNISELTLAVVRDDRKLAALDENLRAATRMHTLSSIYLGAVHDLRAPISAMVMNLELLEDLHEDGLKESEAEESVNYIRILKEELNRLQRFLNSFLENATVKKSESIENFDINATIVDLCKLFSTQATQIGVQIDCVTSEQPLHVTASSDQIRQVLMNLFVNAMEAMRDGGELTVILSKDSGEVCVDITDTGPGIPTSVLGHIFELHFTTKSNGTGIGLYVSKRVVEKYHGRLEVKSKLGSGTSFKVYLPYSDS